MWRRQGTNWCIVLAGLGLGFRYEIRPPIHVILDVGLHGGKATAKATARLARIVVGCNYGGKKSIKLSLFLPGCLVPFPFLNDHVHVFRYLRLFVTLRYPAKNDPQQPAPATLTLTLTLTLTR